MTGKSLISVPELVGPIFGAIVVGKVYLSTPGMGRENLIFFFRCVVPVYSVWGYRFGFRERLHIIH